MIKVAVAAFAVLAMTALFPAIPVAAQVTRLDDPHAVRCKALGGSMDGTMCELPTGHSCDAVTFAREGDCFDAEGNLVPEVATEEDVIEDDGSDSATTDPGSESGDPDSPGE
jgi:hypothetical protein